VTLVARIAAAVDRLNPGDRVIVAVDGPDAAGKTTLADAIARQVTRAAVRVSIDDWHNSRIVRARRGDESPVGYYLDSFDYAALAAHLLDPFRDGVTSVQRARFDFKTDAPAAAVTQVRSPTAVLVLDGVFLLRPELRNRWDLSVYVHVPESVTLARATVRDAEHLGGAENTRDRYERRYLPGQALYREAASPLDQADVVIDNSDPLRPLILGWPESI
jgi:uridine kinase